MTSLLMQKYIIILCPSGKGTLSTQREKNIHALVLQSKRNSFIFLSAFEWDGRYWMVSRYIKLNIFQSFFQQNSFLFSRIWLWAVGDQNCTSEIMHVKLRALCQFQRHPDSFIGGGIVLISNLQEEISWFVMYFFYEILFKKPFSSSNSLWMITGMGRIILE